MSGAAHARLWRGLFREALKRRESIGSLSLFHRHRGRGGGGLRCVTGLPASFVPVCVCMCVALAALSARARACVATMRPLPVATAENEGDSTFFLPSLGRRRHVADGGARSTRCVRARRFGICGSMQVSAATPLFALAARSHWRLRCRSHVFDALAAAVARNPLQN